jgi:2-C-methyl-D-erythritol 4-phosphate cytidylyltransferase
MQKYVIIAAGGIGKRMKSSVPKQFLLVNDVPIIIHTINKFQFAIKNLKVIVVLPKEQVDNWEKFCVENDFEFNHQICVGGETRFQSIKNALELIEHSGLVGIHDAVRPLVSVVLIQNVFEFAERNGNAVPAIPLNESIRILDEKKSKTVDRSQYRIIQTPQCFHSDLLKKAYQQEFSESFTDDASVVEKTGAIINLVDGDINNIKITTQQDLLIAETLIASGI